MIRLGVSRNTGRCARWRDGLTKGICLVQVKMRQRGGQGTTEYAILVGVLVVLAIVAITLFRPKLEELWTAIADGINGL